MKIKMKINIKHGVLKEAYVDLLVTALMDSGKDWIYVKRLFPEFVMYVAKKELTPSFLPSGEAFSKLEHPKEAVVFYLKE